MDAGNSNEFASQDALNYWKDVDLYIGGSEHATGHLLYSRFWQKFLFDKGIVPVDEFAKKLINQGMILGTSAFAYRLRIYPVIESDSVDDVEAKTKEIIHFIDENPIFISHGELISIKKIETYETKYSPFKDFYRDFLESRFSVKLVVPFNINFKSSYKSYVPVKYINASDELDIEGLRNDSEFGEKYKGAIFIGEGGQIIKGDNDKYIVSREVEKMSKSKYNVVNPDDICEQYGADTLRLYEMFLGPLEQAKPWNTAGITGVNSFLKKLWRLYFDDSGKIFNDEEPSKESLKTLHKTIKKVIEDINNFSFNTSVSSFMIAVNELTAQNCHSRAILEPLAIIISPYAPHIAEELWSQLGHTTSISEAPFPQFDEKYLVENSKVYPVSFNGKTRFTLELPLTLSKEDIEKAVMAHERTQQQLQGRTPNKVIVVPGKIINIVG